MCGGYEVGLLDCSASFSQSVSDFFSCDFTEKVTLQSRKRVDESSLQCASRRSSRLAWAFLGHHEVHMRSDHYRLHDPGATSPHSTIGSTD